MKFIQPYILAISIVAGSLTATAQPTPSSDDVETSPRTVATKACVQQFDRAEAWRQALLPTKFDRRVLAPGEVVDPACETCHLSFDGVNTVTVVDCPVDTP